MGEFADYALWETMDEEDARLEFRLGKMSYQRAYDLGIIDHLGYEHRSTNSKHKICRRCKKGNLQWGNTDRGWRLFEGRNEHHCS